MHDPSLLLSWTSRWPHDEKDGAHGRTLFSASGQAFVDVVARLSFIRASRRSSPNCPRVAVWPSPLEQCRRRSRDGFNLADRAHPRSPARLPLKGAASGPAKPVRGRPAKTATTWPLHASSETSTVLRRLAYLLRDVILDAQPRRSGSAGRRLADHAAQSLMGLVPIRRQILSSATDQTRRVPSRALRHRFRAAGREIFGLLTVEDNLRMGLAYKSAATPVRLNSTRCSGAQAMLAGAAASVGGHSRAASRARPAARPRC